MSYINIYQEQFDGDDDDMVFVGKKTIKQTIKFLSNISDENKFTYLLCGEDDEGELIGPLHFEEYPFIRANEWFEYVQKSKF